MLSLRFAREAGKQGKQADRQAGIQDMREGRSQARRQPGGQAGEEGAVGGGGGEHLPILGRDGQREEEDDDEAERASKPSTAGGWAGCRES